jgi:hypothetical protein
MVMAAEAIEELSEERKEGYWHDVYAVPWNQITITNLATATCSVCQKDSLILNVTPRHCPHCGAYLR